MLINIADAENAKLHALMFPISTLDPFNFSWWTNIQSLQGFFNCPEFSLQDALAEKTQQAAYSATF